MSKKGKLASLSIILLISVGVWFGIRPDQDDKSLVANYLHEKGYEIISSRGLVDTYVLHHELVQTMPYQMYWSLPGNNPNALYGKQIDVYHHTVKNHPLDHYECCQMKALGKTDTYIFVSEHKIVGGTSFPITPKLLYGGYWSLDGQTQ